ncbi:MAG: NAD(+) synthase [Polyangiaceae bacterium]|nr:NAD(+) synthase [Polyangiaceae bacterium]
MKWIRVAAASLNQTPLDWQHNRDNILGAIAEARAEGASVLCLPELCITGYGCEDAFLSPNTLRTAEAVLLEILPHTQGLLVSLGLPIAHNKAIYNACCLVADGKVVGLSAKRALAGDGIHYEPRWFKAWPRGARSLHTLGGQEVPLGDFVFECDGVRLGFEICEDAWIAERPGAELALDAADIILNPSASHFAFGKHEVRRRLVLEGSRTFGVAYVYANLLGNEAGRAVYDGDTLIASAGSLLARGSRFSFADRQLIYANVDVELNGSQRSRLASYSPHAEVHALCFDFKFPEVAPRAIVGHTRAEWESGSHVKEEEFTRAVALALFDYVRKSRSSGVVVSLSGGADSAAVALLSRFMLDLAAAELGMPGLRAKLSHVVGVELLSTVDEAATRLITTAYQATENSGEVTRKAAKSVAEAIHAEHLELDVQRLVEGYLALAEGALSRKLTWEKDDLALQNIQARVRAPSVWLLANVKQALLLATSNRSEAAVGYATMDGDTAGGLSPIAGIDKAFLRTWLEWVQNIGPSSLYRVPALSAVTVQAPTAELRPHAQHQTDETDLMPYEVLDAIERAAIRDKRSPLECYQLLNVSFPRYQKELGLWVPRFFRLWSRNQWKRERYAPSFHLDDANLDPKTWCRFPILSGGFERELEELRLYLELN